MVEPSETPFVFKEPVGRRVPFILSIPHCGTEFPQEIRDHYKPELRRAPDDTDWHLDRLYDFAPELGVTMIHARYSRWVIDLNRVPDGKPLYNDGRVITELCPTIDFLGDPIYIDESLEPDDEEKERRLAAYYRPYHAQIDEVISELRSEFGSVIFWDGHSIRRSVPSISAEPFPDLILGNNDSKTASEAVIDSALEALQAGPYNVSHNHPFKGGYLTRSKGDPSRGIHALQLEMSKDLYMDQTETKYGEEKALTLKAHLRSVFEKLIDDGTPASRRH